MPFVQRNSMAYYILTGYSLVLLRSLHYYRFSLIILTRNEDVIFYNIFLLQLTPPCLSSCYATA